MRRSSIYIIAFITLLILFAGFTPLIIVKLFARQSGEANLIEVTETVNARSPGSIIADGHIRSVIVYGADGLTVNVDTLASLPWVDGRGIESVEYDVKEASLLIRSNQAYVSVNISPADTLMSISFRDELYALHSLSISDLTSPVLSIDGEISCLNAHSCNINLIAVYGFANNDKHDYGNGVNIVDSEIGAVTTLTPIREINWSVCNSDIPVILAPAND